MAVAYFSRCCYRRTQPSLPRRLGLSAMHPHCPCYGANTQNLSVSSLFSLIKHTHILSVPLSTIALGLFNWDKLLRCRRYRHTASVSPGKQQDGIKERHVESTRGWCCDDGQAHQRRRPYQCSDVEAGCDPQLKEDRIGNTSKTLLHFLCISSAKTKCRWSAILRSQAEEERIVRKTRERDIRDMTTLWQW